MLSKTQLVRSRKAIETLYSGLCTITVRKKYEKADGSVGFKKQVTVRDEPCRLSFSSAAATQPGEAVATVGQTVELFIAPEIEILAGAKVSVTQNSETTHYKRAGVPAKYATHQEIILELWRGWA